MLHYGAIEASREPTIAAKNSMDSNLISQIIAVASVVLLVLAIAWQSHRNGQLRGKNTALTTEAEKLRADVEKLTAENADGVRENVKLFGIAKTLTVEKAELASTAETLKAAGTELAIVAGAQSQENAELTAICETLREDYSKLANAAEDLRQENTTLIADVELARTHGGKVLAQLEKANQKLALENAGLKRRTGGQFQKKKA
jgi:uncharacterized protein involved in exopolysaccharide biosynthesis